MASQSSSSSSTPTNLVMSLKKSLQTAVTKDQPDEIVSILKDLKKQVIATEELIRETKIGVTVNKLKTNSHKAVADLSREIVKKWKNDVGVGNAVGSTKTKPGTTTTTTASPSPAPPSPKPKVENSSTSNSSKTTTTTTKPTSKLSTSSSTPSSSNIESVTTTTTTTTTTTKKPSPSPIPQRRESLNGAPRTHKTDGIDFNQDGISLNDKVRDKCVEMIYDAMSSDSDAPSDLILKRASALELHVHQNEPSNSYRAKIRSLFLNLKAANNPSLREDVVSGEISVSRLYTMSPSEMASEEQQALNRKLAEENLFKAQGAAPQQAETDAFQCGKCKQKRTMYYQMQTRSADEPMTTFVTCLNCNNRWKFS